MTLILRKCKKNGLSSRNFFYGNVGDIVVAPDWNPEPKCGSGLHGLKEGNGNWRLLEGDDWLVIEANDQIVDIDEQKCKFNTGVILFRGNTKKLSKSEFPNKLKINNHSAFEWAQNIGNHDIMIHKINDSNSAYMWALCRGNKDFMINKITEPNDAYLWAVNIGNRDIMIHKITDPINAYLWAYNIGNRDVMMNRITESYWAYKWATSIGNHDVMKPKVIDPYYINKWNVRFPNNQIEEKV